VTTNNTAGCNDGNACTNGDVCSGGSCSSGSAVTCDDDNDCTKDSCDTGSGCQYVADPDAPGCVAECTAFTVQSCYTGDPATKDVGTCKSGHEQCHASEQVWSVCFDQVLPLAADVCGNGLDDDCNGKIDDGNCNNTLGGAVWVDGDNGSDDSGNGSFDNPYATMKKGLSAGKKLVMVKSDADGTTYNEKLNMGGGNHKTTVMGWGPTLPTLSGSIHIVHCYDCTVRDFILEYPKTGSFESDPQSVIDAVHNYRNTWRNIVFTAPHGLPSGKSLVKCHHGYDNLFIDVRVDDVVLEPGNGSASASYNLLHWNDHGAGSQFIRARLGDVSLQGAKPDSLNLTFITAWGYCDQSPDGLTAVRSNLVAGLDMSGMANNSTSFEAFKLGCYLVFKAAAGFVVANNTVADITADNVKFASLNLTKPMGTWITGNIAGPFTADSSTGLTSNQDATVTYSNFFGVTSPAGSKAALGAGMIDTDPQFTNAGAGDYTLKPGSPCVDAGDPAFKDPDGSTSDMGAFGGPFALP